MNKRKMLKVTAIALSMSMLLSIPAFAGTNNGHGKQNGNNGNGFQVQQNKNNENTQLSTAAQFMVNKGFIRGNANGTYNMSSSVKRGDMSIMLVRAFNLPNHSINSKNFFDVSAGSYYYNDIQTIKNLGIAKGDGKNFKPNNNMTLGEALLFVERTLDYAGYKYSDSELRDLFDGRSLSEPATREDVATIIYAVLGNNSPSTTSAAINYVSYEADEDKPITFDEDDFKDVCKNATKETLSYVKFELPTTTYGALYFDYTSSTNYDSKVSSTTKYYYNADTSKDESSLSKVTFVPASNYSGTVKINYTAYTTEGNSYSGIVKLTINEDKLVADDINLGTSSNSAITLDEDDFNGVCKEETKETLSYVKFTLPSTTNGALYYDYTSASDYDSKVSSTSKYYYDSNDGKYLGKVTFVPTANYTGTVQIAYTGYDKDGENFTGTIKIIVK